MVFFLSKKGICPTAGDFHKSCENGSVEIVKLLLKDERIKINPKSIITCANRNKLDVFEVLLADGRFRSALLEINEFEFILRLVRKNPKTSWKIIQKMLEVGVPTSSLMKAIYQIVASNDAQLNQILFNDERFDIHPLGSIEQII